MKLFEAIGMAFALYSRIPMPPLDWESDSRRWALHAFPLVGFAVGGLQLGWVWLCHTLGLNPLLFASGLTAIPFLLTGGIHMDGFCDVCDARASHQSRERKLEILKDPHVGSFAVLFCVLYLLMTTALWTQADRWDRAAYVVLPLLPVYVRTLSAWQALNLPNARGSGMLALVAEQKRPLPWLPGVLAALCWAGFAAVRPIYLLAAFAGGLAALWCVRVSMREFGGTTGDLSGWMLQISEQASLFGLVIAQRLEGFF